MHKHHFLRVIERLESQHTKPTMASAWPWFGTAVAFLTAWIANDAKDVILPPAGWDAMYVILGFGSLVWGTFTLWQGWKANKDKRTPEQILEQVLKGMDEDNRRLAAMQERVSKAANLPISSTSRKEGSQN